MIARFDIYIYIYIIYIYIYIYNIFLNIYTKLIIDIDKIKIMIVKSNKLIWIVIAKTYRYSMPNNV
jgi:hypothetical protein